jgi:hypothetical protein
MNTTSGTKRKSRARQLAPEILEGKQLMSAGMGSTFAILPGTISTAGQVSSVQFKLDSSEFTPGRGGKILFGIDVAANPNSSLKPEIVSIKNSSDKIAAKVKHSTYSSAIIKAQKLGTPLTSAVMASLPIPKAGQPAAVYTIQVRGNFQTTGGYLVGFYMPGDSNGDGAVTQTDLQTIRSKLGAKSSGSKYSFDSDVNRDGKISASDLSMASQNLGAKTTVAPIVSVNLDPATDGPLHSRITNFRTVHFTGTATPNAAVTFTEANKNSPGATTTSDSTGNYSIMVPLGDGSNTFTVTTKDGFGQSISGAISPVTYSTTPPTVVNKPSDLTAQAGQYGSGSTTTS